MARPRLPHSEWLRPEDVRLEITGPKMGAGAYGSVQAGRLRVKASGKVKRVAVKIPHIYRDHPRPFINRREVRKMEAAARRLHAAGLNVPKTGFMQHEVGGRRLWVQVTPLFGSSGGMDYHGLENTQEDVERKGRRIARSRLDSANAVRREPLAGKEERTFLRAERVRAQRNWRSAYSGRSRFVLPDKLPAEEHGKYRLEDVYPELARHYALAASLGYLLQPDAIQYVESGGRLHPFIMDFDFAHMLPRYRRKGKMMRDAVTLLLGRCSEDFRGDRGQAYLRLPIIEEFFSHLGGGPAARDARAWALARFARPDWWMSKDEYVTRRVRKGELDDVARRAAEWTAPTWRHPTYTVAELQKAYSQSFSSALRSRNNYFIVTEHAPLGKAKGGIVAVSYFVPFADYLRDNAGSGELKEVSGLLGNGGRRPRRKIGYFGGMAVDEGHRRKGLAAEHLRLREEFARRHGFTHALAYTSPDVPGAAERLAQAGYMPFYQGRFGSGMRKHYFLKAL